MEKLLLVDGSNLLFQMFYGMPARIVNGQGKAIQGTLGFVGALLKMLRMTCPTHAAVLFDGECANPRRELDENYKANREDFSALPEEDTPFSQLPDIFAALDYIGIPYAETTDCETDDWMAGYALQWGKDRAMVIASQDSDFYQLLSENVSILRYRGDHTTFMTPQTLADKLGIRPEQYADFKSLTGDGSDNIPGVPKIGPKTAAALLQQFGSVENMLLLSHLIAKPSIRTTVEAHTDRIRKNQLLITLRAGASLPFREAQLCYTDRDLTTGKVLSAIGLR